MATIQISDELLQSLEKRAEQKGLEVNQLAETVITEFLTSTLEEDELGIPLDELLESIRQDEATGITVSHEEIKAMAASLIAKYRTKEQQA